MLRDLPGRTVWALWLLDENPNALHVPMKRTRQTRQREGIDSGQETARREPAGCGRYNVRLPAERKPTFPKTNLAQS